MSTLPDANTLWIPETITNIAYRVIMILVSLAFIWMKYRQRPVRSLDEEQLIDIVLPTRTSPNDRREATRGDVHMAFADFITSQLESMIQSTLDFDNDGNDNPPSVSLDITNARSEAATSSSSTDCNTNVDRRKERRDVGSENITQRIKQ